MNLPKARLSAIVCAYNEATRINRVLDTICDHPLFGEIIVVDFEGKSAAGGRRSLLHAPET